MTEDRTRPPERPIPGLDGIALICSRHLPRGTVIASVDVYDAIVEAFDAEGKPREVRVEPEAHNSLLPRSAILGEADCPICDAAELRVEAVQAVGLPPEPT